MFFLISVPWQVFPAPFVAAVSLERRPLVGILERSREDIGPTEQAVEALERSREVEALERSREVVALERRPGLVATSRCTRAAGVVHRVVWS